MTSSSLIESPTSLAHDKRTAVVIESPSDSKGSTMVDSEAVCVREGEKKRECV